MHLEVVFKILSAINNAGIKQVILEKKENSVLIRCADESKSVIVFSEMEGSFIDETIGVHRISTLFDRMKLFDCEKAKVTTTAFEGGATKAITIKEGRKRVSFTCAKPDTIEAPSGMVNDEIVNTIVINKERVDEILKAILALNPEYVSLEGDGDDILIKLFDGVSDNFTDIIGTNTSGSWSNHWKKEHLVKLLRQATKSNDEVMLGIGKHGILYIEVDEITFMLRPQAV